jgi:uncharacterized membrane protein
VTDGLLYVLTFVATLGAGLIGGLFFAFSTFVMAALGRLAPAGGIAAMQSINVAVLNPMFFTAFFGTAALCIVLVFFALVNGSSAPTMPLLAGSLLYLIGTILVTILFNVPLNNRLATVAPESAEGADMWRHYLNVWTAWNHVRTVAALAAAACFIVALVREGA